MLYVFSKGQELESENVNASMTTEIEMENSSPFNDIRLLDLNFLAELSFVKDLLYKFVIKKSLFR